METLEQEPTLKEVFVIDSEEKVNWVLSQLANLDAESARIKAQADTRQKQIASERQGLLYQFEADLKAFTEKKIAEQGGKRKSVVLMQGTLAFRTAPGGLQITDKEAAWDYVADLIGSGLEIDLISTKVIEELDTTAYILRAKETGELLPGIENVPERETFSIKFPKPKGEENNAPAED